MKRTFFGTILLALVIGVPLQTMARVDVRVDIGFPPPIAFAAPPNMVVLPDTNNVYAVPDLDVDLFFWNGWWWRPWEGHWYRSRYYDRGWAYYRDVPSFYHGIDPDWRGYSRDRNWHGRQWPHERVVHPRPQRNWPGWHNDRPRPQPPHRPQPPERLHGREREHRR